MKKIYLLTLAICLAFISSCSASEKQETTKARPHEEKGSVSFTDMIRVTSTLSIDPSAFVEGLVYENGKIYVSTGLDEHSTLRIIDAASGEELKSIKIPDEFCEGIAIYGEFIYQLTWHDGLCYVYDKSSLKKVKELHYRGEGWGLANDGKNLIMSNGSATLQFINPKDFSVVKTLNVQDANGLPVYNLNELEYIDGKLWANIWQSDDIIEIDPASGKVEHTVKLGTLREQLDPENKYAEVLNGIAYNSADKTFLVTGKFWGKIFAIQF